MTTATAAATRTADAAHSLAAGLREYRIREAAKLPQWARATLEDLQAAESDPDPHGSDEEQFEAYIQELCAGNPYM